MTCRTNLYFLSGQDVKTKPSLNPPDQYIEIGLWRQVMQINQQISRKMEELDKMEENSPDISKVQGVCRL